MIENFVNHSGGATGADTQWDIQGRLRGFNNHIHYWYLKPNSISKPEHEITLEQYKEGIKHIKIANKTLQRKNIDKYMHLLARNWYQVCNSDSVYAIGTFQDSNMVNGGTAYAVQMSLNNCKPVYFFEQNHEQWYYYNYFTESFEDCETEDVLLTEQYAGIGTRQINDAGIKAIIDVYENTLKYI